MFGHYKHIIYLQDKDKEKVTEFFKKEFGITNIAQIDGTPKEFRVETIVGSDENSRFISLDELECILGGDVVAND